jgi:hypothetical protein
VVDHASGSDYSAALLESYRDLHEQRVAYEHVGIRPISKWLHSLSVEKHPFFCHDTKLNLSKLNLILGRAGVGKSSLCQLIANAFTESDLPSYARPQGPSDYTLTILDPGTKRLRVLHDFATRKFLLDDTEYFFPPIPMEIVYPKNCTSMGSGDVVETISTVFGWTIERTATLLLSQQMKGIPSLMTWTARNDDGKLALSIDVHHDGKQTPFEWLSIGEQSLTILSIAQQASAVFSETGSVLQVIDNQFVTSLDSQNLNRYLGYLSDPIYGYQTLLVFPSPEVLALLDEWRVFWVERTDQGVSVRGE